MHACNALARQTALVLLFLVATEATADRDSRESGAQYVIGPSNPDLSEGARRLLAGDVEDGIRLTRQGLAVAAGTREQQAGLSNLCAGYLRLEQWDTALAYCNEALEINPRNWRALCNRALIHLMEERFDAAAADLDVADEVAPNASNLKAVRVMLNDAMNPVVPTVVIDDSRDSPGEGRP